MNYFFTLIAALFIFSNSVQAQSPNWTWAKTFGTAQDDAAQSSVTDAAGNTYVSGYYSPSGSTDAFIRKYDINGALTWSASAGGSGSENATAITLDASGNIYITGFFTNSSPVFGTFTLTNPTASKDVFVVKYNSTGTVMWAKNFGGTADDFPYSITTDASGNVYVAGYFGSPGITIGTTTLTNTGVEDMFLAKYDAGGNAQWARSSNGDHAEGARSVKTDASGNVYVTGYFYSKKPVFGTDTLYNMSITNPPAFDPDGVDMFLVKYNSSGSVVWAKRAGGAEHEYGYALAIDGTAVYVGGYFSSSSFLFGSTTINNTGNGTNIFLAKYDQNGNVAWANGAGGTVNEYLHSVVTDGTGNVYISGQFNSSNMAFGTATLSLAGNMDAFLAKYNSAGVIQTAIGIGGTDHENAMSLTSDGTDIYAAGYYRSSALSFSSTTITNTGGFDMYLAKLNMTSVGVTTVSRNEDQINIYPNPSEGKFFITIPHNKEAHATIYDVTGKKIMEKKINNTGSEIDLSLNGPGIYFVKVDSNEHPFTKKIIVKD
jgi:hypothetical protein